MEAGIGVFPEGEANKPSLKKYHEWFEFGWNETKGIHIFILSSGRTQPSQFFIQALPKREGYGIFYIRGET
jgi:hypothetical protein